MALPGVQTIIKDRFYTLSRTDLPVGPKVLAIAGRNTADRTGGVPDYDPYRATNEKSVIEAFGEGSQAHRAYLELASGGAARIFIVALPKGTTDSDIASTSAVTIAGDGTDHDHGAHIPLDRSFEAAETELPDIIVPWGRGGHPLDWESPATPGNDPGFGFHADNTTTPGNSLAKRVADKCAEISGRSHPVFAVLGIKPFMSTVESMTATDMASHVSLANLVSRDAADFGENGMYIDIVATELKTVGYPTGFGYSNGAAVYAGFLSQLKSWSAATQKVVFNVTAIRYNPTRPQQESIIDKGVCPVSLDFNRAPIWVDSPTFAKTGSDYARQTTLRIIFDGINVVRNVAQGFIGEGATLQQRNALETAISAALRGMQQAGALLSSDFNVQYVPADNKAIIDLILNPAFEMRNIEISVSVQL
jgi:hypothetical protein